MGQRSAEAPASSSDRRESSRSLARRRRFSDNSIAFSLGLLALLIYNLNFRTIAVGDSRPARFLPFSLLTTGSLYLDPVAEAVRGDSDAYWLLQRRDGHFVSVYPILTPVLVTPLYLPATLYLRMTGWNRDRLEILGEVMEKFSASVVASSAVGLMYVLLRRRLERSPALGLTALFAFGTNTWITSSQGLWQHGPAELFAILALLCMARRPPTLARALLGGLSVGLLVANRPSDGVLALGFCIYAVYWARAKSVIFFSAAALPILLTLVYNLVVVRTAAGGYARILPADFFSHPIYVGVAGLLASPGKGLFVFSPFLAFLPALYRRGWRESEGRVLTLCLAVGCIGHLLLMACTDWRGGYSYGPRYLVETLPLLIWMLAPIVATLGQVGKALFVLAGVWSIYVQAFGAFAYAGHSEHAIYSSPRGVWSFANAPFVYERSNGLAEPRLLRLLGKLSEPG